MRREFALPGTRSQYAPDHLCDLRHVRIAIELDVEARRIHGRCSLTVAPIAGPIERLRLDAVELDIVRVATGEQSLHFRHDGRVLEVELDGIESEIVLDIDYSGQPRRGLYFVGPDEGYPDRPVQVWTQGQDEDSRFWFPCFDAPHEKATSEVIATVPQHFRVLSNGDLVSDRVEETSGRRTVHWHMDTPHSIYLITLVAAELVEIRERWRNVDVVYYAAPGQGEDTQRTLARTPEMLELFSNTFGMAYPYKKYAQIFVADFIFGGMENTTATTLTDLVLIDERAALDYDVEHLVAHELAHQWFGDLVTCRDWSQGWLNEGFATYAEYVWFEHSRGTDDAAMELAQWAHAYFSEDIKRYRRVIATNRYDSPIDIFDHHLYQKGGWVLHMLRRLLGDDLFWRSVGHYLDSNRHGSVQTHDLARSVERSTGRVLDWFFEQWVTGGAGHPELDIHYSWDPERQHASVLVQQTQTVDNQTPLFRVPTHMRFRVGDSDVDCPLEITAERQQFFFPLEEEPSQAIFDPGRYLLAQVKMEKSEPLWLAELSSATAATDRIAAAHALGRRGGARITDALIRSMSRDSFWGVGCASAMALGEIRTTRARDALIDALADGSGIASHPKVRRSICQTLGLFHSDDVAANALSAIVTAGDASYFVEAEACLALGKTRAPQAPAVLRQALGRDSFQDMIRRNTYLGLAAALDDESAPILTKACGYGHPPPGRRAALTALAQLVQGRRDRDSRDARELAERMLRDPDMRMKMTAIEALGIIGDTASIAELDKVSQRDLDGRLRRRAREVIRDLREGAQMAEERRLMREQVDTLRTEVISLRDRLDGMEAALADLDHLRDALKEKKKKKKQKKTPHAE